MASLIISAGSSGPPRMLESPTSAGPQARADFKLRQNGRVTHILAIPSGRVSGIRPGCEARNEVKQRFFLGRFISTKQ